MCIWIPIDIVFSSHFQLQLLQKAKRWFLDGTFKIVGKPFTPTGQLFSINAFVHKDGKQRQFPLVFSLMSRRKKSDYVEVLTAVLEKMEEATVESMVLDFEIGAWQAVKDVSECRNQRLCFSLDSVGIQKTHRTWHVNSLSGTRANLQLCKAVVGTPFPSPRAHQRHFF